ncbi:MAG: hypothetical protein JO147_05340 [Actinobacteria bacterium]|nr:hypothetical protein [Actinomycetota bacterium]
MTASCSHSSATGAASFSSDDLAVSRLALVEIVAFLVTAARTQLDEAAEYAPLRLMAGARRLTDMLAPVEPGPLGRLIEAVESLPSTAVPRGDRAGYVAAVDDACRAVADCLLALDPEPRTGAV